MQAATMRLTVISGQHRLVRDLTPDHLKRAAKVIGESRDLLAGKPLTVLVTTDNVTHIICRRPASV